MSRWKWIPIIAAVAAGAFYFLNWEDTVAEPPAEPLTAILKVKEEPLVPSSQRIGVNLSYWTTYGAEQYMRNILKNPGFEGQIDRIVVIVQRKDENSFSDGSGLGQNDGDWNGATYDVRSGPAAGQTGKIEKSLKAGFGGLPQYFVEGALPDLNENDVVVLTKFTNPEPVQQWWVSQKSLPYVKVDETNHRPQSAGHQSLLLAPADGNSAEINFYLDMLTDQYGKLLTLKGPWRLSFWIKKEGGEAEVNTFFRRINANTFVKKEFQPTSEWEKMEFDFNPEDNGPNGPLQFQISANGENVKVYLDDIALGPIQSEGENAWREDVVDMLKKMRPAYLRDWQGQTSDTFENRIASDDARKNYMQRNFGGQGSSNFSYSIPDFLSLCQQVQANPWIVIPTTLSDEELEGLGNYLAVHANQDQFSEVLVEFGNENWNWLFRSQGIPLPASHGPVAERAFHLVAKGAGPNVPLRKAINGQYANPGMCEEFLNGSPSADILGIAPYFFNQMEAGTSDKEILQDLFSVNDQNYQKISSFLGKTEKKLGVYEINLHTTTGNAPTSERDRFVPSAAAGSALGKHLLVALENKASPVCVFCLAQIATKATEAPNNGEIPLWGICRDVSTTKRLRPTGLAVQMINQVIAGSIHSATAEKETPIKATAFRTADQWSAAVVSSHPEAATVTLQFPADGRQLPKYGKVLDAQSPLDNNEKEEMVKISPIEIMAKESTISLQIPAYGFAILTGENE